jgi:hypothetical protein
MRTLSKGNKPWSTGSDNRGLLFEVWLAVMVTVETEPIIHFWRVFPADRKTWSPPGKYAGAKNNYEKLLIPEVLEFKQWQQWFHVPGS